MSKEKDQIKGPTLLQTLFTGLTAGIADFGGLHPLMRAKLLCQGGASFSKVFNMFKETPSMMYKGAISYTLFMTPISPMRFCLHEFFKKHIDNPSMLANLASAYSAGAISALFWSNQAELINMFRLQQDLMEKDHKPMSFAAKTPLGIIKEIIQTKGVSKMFVGGATAVARDGPHTATILVITPEVYKYFQPYLGSSITNTLLSCGSTSLVSSTFTHIFDVIKSAQQRQFTMNCLTGSTESYGLYDTITKIYHDKGLKGFTTAFSARGIWFVTRVIVNALTLSGMSEFWSSFNNTTDYDVSIGDDGQLAYTPIQKALIDPSDDNYYAPIIGDSLERFIEYLSSGSC